MRELTYHGRAHVRRLGPADGLDVEREWRPGVPLSVSEDDAERVLSGPAAAEFTAADPTPPEGDTEPEED